MGFNKKILSKAVSELGKAKAPGKPKDIITDPAGQWKYPGQKTRIPGNDITMQGVPYPVWAQPNVGPGSMMQPNQDYNFPGASYVDETPMAKKGGEADYEDLELTDEEIQAYRDGGYVVEELPEAQVGGPQNTAGPRAEPVVTNPNDYGYEPMPEEKAKMMNTIVQNAGKGNIAARRMMNPNAKSYTFTGNEYDEQRQEPAGIPAGEKGSHFSSSMDTSFVPFIQEGEDGNLQYNEYANPNDKEAIKFNTEEEANFFANHYKKANPPMMRGWEKKQGGYVQHELVKAQGGKTVYSGPNRGLVGPSTPKNNGSPLLPKQDLIKKYQQEVDKAKAAKIAEAEKIRQKAIAKQKAINDAIPRGPVSDNTRTVIPNQVISDINNAAFYKSPQETADREARKKEQAAFEKEQWNKYNKMSFAEKALDRTQAAIAHPILMAGNALTGNQGYIPGMGRGLMNTESPEYDKYLKATRQTKGQFEISDLANIVNPGYWAGNAGNELHKGNYIKGVTDLGFGLMGLKGAKNASGLVKGSANVLNKTESKISKLIPERAPNTSVNTGSTLNAGISPQLIKNTIGPGNKVLANLADYAYFSPFFSKTLNKYNPLNLLRLGKKLEGAVKPLGNVLGKSIKNNKLTGGKSLFGKAKLLSTQVGNKNLNQIYAAKFDGSIPGSQLQLSEANPQSWFGKTFRKPTYSIQNKAGNNLSEVPLYDQGVELFRKYPFMNRYAPINKQKLINGQFQWSTTGAGLQNVAEKYGKTAVIGGLGAGAYNAYNYDKNDPSKTESYTSPLEFVKNPDPYFVREIYQGLNPTQEEKNGGSIESWEDDLDEEEIKLLKEAGFIVEDVNSYQVGGGVSDTWEKVTGTSWDTAKQKGYTSGSYDDNINLLKQLNEGKFNSINKTIQSVKPIINKKNVVKTPIEINTQIKTAKSFNEAFSIARNTMGPNQIFEYNGRKYGTNQAGETFKPSEEVLKASGLDSTKVKERLNKQNTELNSPYLNKKTVKLQPDAYVNWEKVKAKNLEINKNDNAQKIINYNNKLNSTKNYVIVDKKKGLMHIYAPGNPKPLFSSAVDLGYNKSDAQTTTKVQDTNGDGIIDKKEAQIGKADFSKGNKSTGAGKYYISNIDTKGYGGLPLFNMMSEAQHDAYLKTGKIDNVATSFHKGYVADDYNRVSNGCIRCNKTTLDNLTKYLKNSSEVYILPEDDNNNFVYENGKLNFQTKHKTNLYTYKNNGNIYKKENNVWYAAPKVGTAFKKITDPGRVKLLNTGATSAGYNFYEDSHKIVQQGQGINKSTNTLNYIPIKTTLDEATFKKNNYKDSTTNNEKLSDNFQLLNVKTYVDALATNKQKIMKATKINGDVYNELAKMSFGILGTESNYADTHTPAGNFGRAVGKLLKPTSSSSPDYYSKYYTYGAKDNSNSVGLTQMRWSYLNASEKAALKELGITSNKDFIDPKKAAIGTTAILAIRYNEQLDNTQKQDVWQYLPTKWNTRDNYASRVKNNSRYMSIAQQNKNN